MLMYGPSRCLQYIDTSSFKVLNLTGMIEGFDSIQALIPPQTLGKFSTYEFDVNYYNYIMENDGVFILFFRIIQFLYSGKDVYIISDEQEWCESLIESLLKIIQQRYGYNAYPVSSDEDVLYALQRDESYFNSSYGLANLDVDKTRYQYIVNNINLQNPQLHIKEYYK